MCQTNATCMGFIGGEPSPQRGRAPEFTSAATPRPISQPQLCLEKHSENPIPGKVSRPAGAADWPMSGNRPVSAHTPAGACARRMRRELPSCAYDNPFKLAGALFCVFVKGADEV